jgi:hypothetical protein
MKYHFMLVMLASMMSAHAMELAESAVEKPAVCSSTHPTLEEIRSTCYKLNHLEYEGNLIFPEYTDDYYNKNRESYIDLLIRNKCPSCKKSALDILAESPDEEDQKRLREHCPRTHMSPKRRREVMRELAMMNREFEMINSDDENGIQDMDVETDNEMNADDENGIQVLEVEPDVEMLEEEEMCRRCHLPLL